MYLDSAAHAPLFPHNHFRELGQPNALGTCVFAIKITSNKPYFVSTPEPLSFVQLYQIQHQQNPLDTGCTRHTWHTF